MRGIYHRGLCASASIPNHAHRGMAGPLDCRLLVFGEDLVVKFPEIVFC